MFGNSLTGTGTLHGQFGDEGGWGRKVPGGSGPLPMKNYGDSGKAIPVEAERAYDLGTEDCLAPVRLCWEPPAMCLWLLQDPGVSRGLWKYQALHPHPLQGVQSGPGEDV